MMDMDWEDQDRVKALSSNVAMFLIGTGLAAMVLALLLGLAWHLFVWMVSA